MVKIVDDAIEVHEGIYIINGSKLVQSLIKELIVEIKKKDAETINYRLKTSIGDLIDKVMLDIYNSASIIEDFKAGCAKSVYFVEDKVYNDFKNYRKGRGLLYARNKLELVISKCVEWENSNKEWQMLENELKSALDICILEGIHFRFRIETMPEKNEVFESALRDFLQREKEARKQQQIEEKQKAQEVERIQRSRREASLYEKQQKKKELLKQEQRQAQLLQKEKTQQELLEQNLPQAIPPQKWFQQQLELIHAEQIPLLEVEKPKRPYLLHVIILAIILLVLSVILFNFFTQKVPN